MGVPRSGNLGSLVDHWVKCIGKKWLGQLSEKIFHCSYKMNSPTSFECMQKDISRNINQPKSVHLCRRHAKVLNPFESAEINCTCLCCLLKPKFSIPIFLNLFKNINMVEKYKSIVNLAQSRAINFDPFRGVLLKYLLYSILLLLPILFLMISFFSFCE